MSDPYTTLGVDRTASDDEIKKAYRKLVKKHHPDAGGDEELFKEINRAYEDLTKGESASGYGPNGPNPGEWHRHSAYGHSPFEDIFGRGSQHFYQHRNMHIQQAIAIPLAQLESGSTIQMRLMTGHSVGVVIPPNTKVGQRIEVDGPFPQGVSGITITIEAETVDPNVFFQGNQILINRNIGLHEVLFNVPQKLTTPLGRTISFSIDMPSGTTSSKFAKRLRGLGLEDVHGNVGDIIVMFETHMPTEVEPLTDEERAEMAERFQ